MAVTGYNFDHTVLIYDVTNTSHAGRGTARLGGKPDMSGTITGDLDIDLAPFGATLAITPGTSGTIYFYVSNTNAQGGGNVFGKAISCPVIVEKLHFETAIQSEMKFSLDVKMDILAPNAPTPALPGLLAYPSAA